MVCCLVIVTCTQANVSFLLDPSYIHLPDINTFVGLINLLSLCNLLILGNVLDFRTYSPPDQQSWDEIDTHGLLLLEHFDRSNINKEERLSIMLGRGIALELMRWVRDFCVVTSPDGIIIPDLPSRYICQQVVALLKYKQEAEHLDIIGAPHCTLELLKKQVNNVMSCDDLYSYWTQQPSLITDDTSFGFGSMRGYSLQWKHSVSNLRTYEQLLNDGATDFDRKFVQGEQYRFDQDHETVAAIASNEDEGRVHKRFCI